MSVGDQEKIIECIGRFMPKMLNKILKKMREGYGGWDDQDCAAYMQRQLTKHAKKGDYVDVANIAMFLDYLESEDKK